MSRFRFRDGGPANTRYGDLRGLGGGRGVTLWALELQHFTPRSAMMVSGRIVLRFIPRLAPGRVVVVFPVVVFPVFVLRKKKGRQMFSFRVQFDQQGYLLFAPRLTSRWRRRTIIGHLGHLVDRNTMPDDGARWASGWHRAMPPATKLTVSHSLPRAVSVEIMAAYVW